MADIVSLVDFERLERDLQFLITLEDLGLVEIEQG